MTMRRSICFSSASLGCPVPGIEGMSSTATPSAASEPIGAQLAHRGFEHARQLAGRRAVVAFALQAAVDDVDHEGRQVGLALADRLHVLREDANHQRVVVRRLVGELAGEALEHHDAERPHVGRAVDVVASGGLLGAHVGGRAHDGAGLGEAEVGGPAGVEDLADPEVEDLADEPAGGRAVQEDVRRLHVAVNDALLMGEVERARHAGADVTERLGVDRPFALDARGEGLAVEQLEDQERRAVLGLAEVEDPHDARVLHAADRLGLVEEATQEHLVAHHLGLHDLQSHVAVDELVASRPDGAARAGAESAG